MNEPKKEKKHRWYFTYRPYLYAWLISIALFILQLVISQGKNEWSVGEMLFLIGNILLGIGFFGLLSLVLIWKYKWARIIYGIGLVFGVLSLIGLIYIASHNQDQQAELIDCYVNGTPVMATRENCRVLSLQPTPLPQQPAQVRVIQSAPQPAPIQVPRIEPPTKCVTSENYLSGNIETRCSKSWF
jgi:hypothetical protein